jgi:peptidoglycan/LPS O-acetylase OafA/YrhL
MDASSPKSGTRLRSIDVLRGCAALAVILSHAVPSAGSAFDSTPWLRTLSLILGHGTLGVPLFFVISGFCIHLRWAKEYSRSSKKQLDFFDFWKRRIHRLYPPYFVMLCISMTLMLIAYFMGLANLYPEPKLRWLSIDFVAHAFMLHGLHPLLDEGGGNPPMWTLAREEYFYIMYFGLLAWRRTRGLATTLGGVLILGLIFPQIMRPLLPADSSWWRIVNTSAIVLWIQWCLGMVAVEAYYGIIKLPRWCSASWMIPIWFGLGKLSAFYYPVLTPVLWGLTFFTLVNYCIVVEKSGRWPENAFVKWLSGVGVFSYSLYLVHNPVLNVSRRLIEPVVGDFTSIANPWLALLIMFVQVIAAYAIAKLFFYLVERHFLNEKPRHIDPKPAVVPEEMPIMSAKSAQT